MEGRQKCLGFRQCDRRENGAGVVCIAGIGSCRPGLRRIDRGGRLDGTSTGVRGRG